MDTFSLITLGVVSNMTALFTPINTNDFIISKSSDSAMIRQLPYISKEMPTPTISQEPLRITVNTKVLPQKQTVVLKDNPKTDTTKAISFVTPEDIARFIDIYALQFNVDANKLITIAFCESTNKPGATNGIYGGLFQFDNRTWQSNRNALGLDPDPSLRFNPEEAVKTAAFLMSRRGVQPWPICGKK